MKQPFRMPFKNLTAVAWKRLALAAVFLLYLLNIGFINYKVGTLNGLGTDYLAFWSAGKVADRFGYRNIYDLEILGQVQYQPISHLNIPTEFFQPIPVPYFSIFIIPFQFLSKLDATVGFWIWTIVNLLLLIGYLIFFSHKLSEKQRMGNLSKFVLISLLVSYPVYTNIVYGQAEVFLVICAGEFIRCALAKKPLASGAWLGGMLLKPQLLLLVIPALLLMKNWKAVLGFMISAMGVILASIVLSGVEGLVSMIRLWFVYVPGIATNSPQAMANWRMLATNLNTWSNSTIGWYLAGVGMLATLVIWLLLCMKRPSFGSNYWVITMMAIFAASCAFTWHSHIHMGMVLIPFLLFFAAFKLPSTKIIELDVWVFAYPAALMAGYALSFLLLFLSLPIIENLSSFLLGLAGLAVYMFIAAKGLGRKETQASVAG